MLDTEIKYFQDHREELKKLYPGKFVVIKGDAVIAAYDTREAAFTGAAEKFGQESVLIRRPEDTDEMLFIPALAFGLISANI